MHQRGDGVQRLGGHGDGERTTTRICYLFKQATWALLGLLLVPLVMRIDYRNYRQPVVIWTALGRGRPSRWSPCCSAARSTARRAGCSFGPLGVQPSELAKIAVIVFIAALLERRMDRIDEPATRCCRSASWSAAIVGLILPSRTSAPRCRSLMIAAVMVFAAGINYRYVVGPGAGRAAGALLPACMTSDYRRRRVLAFLDPWADPLGDGFQMIQSMIAVGTGGVFGRGLMGGVQKLFYLPEPHNDFIYAVIAEELGLIGATVVLACFCVITWRGLRTAMRAPDRFGAFLALGLTTMVAFQAFFNISVVLGLLPTKGIPLPFVSYGGSSLLINLSAWGSC